MEIKKTDLQARMVCRSVDSQHPPRIRVPHENMSRKKQTSNVYKCVTASKGDGMTNDSATLIWVNKDM
jgi:hypothetical protein